MQLAIRFARLVRLFSGDGYQRIHVGGYSAGVSIAFSVASADTARHRGRRDIRGIVAIDDAFETDPADSAGDCEDLEFFDMQLASGVYNEDQTFIVEVATLAATDPDGPSVFGPPGFTNLQFANVLAVLPFSGTFHVFGGEFDEAGFPVPTFTDQDFLVQQAMLLERALPLRISRDLSAIRCSDTPVFDFDAGLADITVPVLHIGAAGGNGNAIDYTLGQIASTDITSSLVQLLPPGQEAFDYGHGDVFAATDADIRAWQPMVDWIKAR